MFFYFSNSSPLNLYLYYPNLYASSIDIPIQKWLKVQLALSASDSIYQYQIENPEDAQILISEVVSFTPFNSPSESSSIDFQLEDVDLHMASLRLYSEYLPIDSLLSLETLPDLSYSTLLSYWPFEEHFGDYTYDKSSPFGKYLTLDSAVFTWVHITFPENLSEFEVFNGEGGGITPIEESTTEESTTDELISESTTDESATEELTTDEESTTEELSNSTSESTEVINAPTLEMHISFNSIVIVLSESSSIISCINEENLECSSEEEWMFDYYAYSITFHSDHEDIEPIQIEITNINQSSPLTIQYSSLSLALPSCTLQDAQQYTLNFTYLYQDQFFYASITFSLAQNALYLQQSLDQNNSLQDFLSVNNNTLSFKPSFRGFINHFNKPRVIIPSSSPVTRKFKIKFKLFLLMVCNSSYFLVIFLELLSLSQESMDDIIEDQELTEIFLQDLEMLTQNSSSPDILNLLDIFFTSVSTILQNNVILNPTYELLENRKLDILSDQAIDTIFSIFDLFINNSDNDESLSEEVAEEIIRLRDNMIICCIAQMELNEERSFEKDFFQIKLKKFSADSIKEMTLALEGKEDSISNINFPDLDISCGEDYLTLSLIEDKTNLYHWVQNVNDIYSNILSASLISDASLTEKTLQNLSQNISLIFYVQNSQQLEPICQYFDSTLKEFVAEGISLGDVVLDPEGNGIIECLTNHLTPFGVANNPLDEAQIILDQQQLETLLQIGALANYKCYESAVFWFLFSFTVLLLPLSAFFSWKDKRVFEKIQSIVQTTKENLITRKGSNQSLRKQTLLDFRSNNNSNGFLFRASELQKKKTKVRMMPLTTHQRRAMKRKSRSSSHLTRFNSKKDISEKRVPSPHIKCPEENKELTLNFLNRSSNNTLRKWSREEKESINNRLISPERIEIRVGSDTHITESPKNEETPLPIQTENLQATRDLISTESARIMKRPTLTSFSPEADSKPDSPPTPSNKRKSFKHVFIVIQINTLYYTYSFIHSFVSLFRKVTCS